jgi:ankyrin repeat protein
MRVKRCSLAALHDSDPRAIARVASLDGNVTCGGVEGPLPLDEAVLADSPERVHVLLESRPDRHMFAQGCERQRGVTPLMWAASSSLNAAALIRLLLEHGADPALRDWRGKTALGYAPTTAAERSRSHWVADDEVILAERQHHNHPIQLPDYPIAKFRITSRPPAP